MLTVGAAPLSPAPCEILSSFCHIPCWRPFVCKHVGRDLDTALVEDRSRAAGSGGGALERGPRHLERGVSVRATWRGARHFEMQ